MYDRELNDLEAQARDLDIRLNKLTQDICTFLARIAHIEDMLELHEVDPGR